MGLWHGKVAEAGYARIRRTLAQVELTPHGDTPPLIDPATGVLGRRTPGWLAGRRTPGWPSNSGMAGWLAGWLAVELLAGWLAGI